MACNGAELAYEMDCAVLGCAVVTVVVEKGALP